MNRKKRMKHRETAGWLRDQQVCPECGEKGLHWVNTPTFLTDILASGDIRPRGFWTCAKFYKDGVRIGVQGITPDLGAAIGALTAMLSKHTQKRGDGDYLDIYKQTAPDNAFFDPDALRAAVDKDLPPGKLRFGDAIVDLTKDVDPFAKIPTGLKMFDAPEGGFKPGQLISFAALMGRPPSGYKSDIRGYFMRKGLENAKTDEERQKIIDAYTAPLKLNYNLESTPEMDKDFQDSFIATLVAAGFFDKGEKVLTIQRGKQRSVLDDLRPYTFEPHPFGSGSMSIVDQANSFRREMDEELNPPKITQVELLVDPTNITNSPDKKDETK